MTKKEIIKNAERDILRGEPKKSWEKRQMFLIEFINSETGEIEEWTAIFADLAKYAPENAYRMAKYVLNNDFNNLAIIRLGKPIIGNGIEDINQTIEWTIIHNVKTDEFKILSNSLEGGM